MDYPVAIEGFEGHEVTLHFANWFTVPQLMFDGQPAAMVGRRRNQFALTRNDGTEAQIKFRNSLFDPVPQLVVDGKVIDVARPLTWYELLWSLLPLAVAVFGGMDGLLLGFAGAWVNSQLFRSQRSIVQKYVLAGVVSLVCGLLGMLLGGFLHLPSL